MLPGVMLGGYKFSLCPELTSMASPPGGVPTAGTSPRPAHQWLSGAFGMKAKSFPGLWLQPPLP